MQMFPPLLHAATNTSRVLTGDTTGKTNGHTTGKKNSDLPLASLPWLLEALFVYWYLVYAALHNFILVQAYGIISPTRIRRDLRIMVFQYFLETILAVAGRCVLMYGKRRTWTARAIYEHHLVSAVILLSGEIYTCFFDPGLRLMTLYGGLFTSFLAMNTMEAWMVSQALGLNHRVCRWLRLPENYLPLESFRIWCSQPVFANVVLWEIRLTYKLAAGWVDGTDAEAAVWLPFLVCCLLGHIYTWRFNILKAKRLLREGWYKAKDE